MIAISQFLNKISNWKSLLFFFLVYMAFNGYFLKNAEEKINSLSGNKNGVIDLTFGFNVEKTLGMVADYSAEARSYYARTELTTDLIYPIVYAKLVLGFPIDIPPLQSFHLVKEHPR